MDGYARGDNYLWRIGVCVRDGIMGKEQSEQSSAAENLAPGCLDLWVSQSTYTWVGLNKMYVNI